MCSSFTVSSHCIAALDCHCCPALKATVAINVITATKARFPAKLSKSPTHCKTNDIRGRVEGTQTRRGRIYFPLDG